MNYIGLSFRCANPAQREKIIAHLSVFDVEGFEETDDELLAFFQEDAYHNEVQTCIAGLDVQGFSWKVEERNWNEEWERNFQPVTIPNEFDEPLVHIRADFHSRTPLPIHELVITPKMSFGTGHHPTTVMMLQMMSEIAWHNKSVIDFGTGTGILAIYAEKLGAAEVLAIDYDKWSIDNAAENIKLNDAEKIRLLQSDALPEKKSADIILANINMNIIHDNFEHILRAGKKGGVILLSGMLAQNENQLRQLPLNGVSVKLTVRKMLDWIAARIEII